MAFLAPVFGQATEHASPTQCLSNVRQVGRAFLMYAQENDDTAPSVWQHGNHVEDFWQLLQPYASFDRHLSGGNRDRISSIHDNINPIFFCPDRVTTGCAAAE